MQAANVRDRIADYIGQSRFRHARWGIDVVDLDSGQVRYSHDADKLFVPASNAKLFTAALALAQFGGDARFHTTLYTSASNRANGILAGDLILYGGGDPSLGDAAVTPATLDWAERFAGAVADLGITRIDGDLIADDTRFAGPAYGTGWEVDDLATWYAARPSALSNANNMIVVEVGRQGRSCCTVSVTPDTSAVSIDNQTRSAAPGGPLFVHRAVGSNRIDVGGHLPDGTASRRFALASPDPALQAAYTLRDALSRHGIRLQGRVRAVHWPTPSAVTARSRQLARIASPPLRELLRQMLKQSDNLYAQVLWLDVGAQRQAGGGACADEPSPPLSTEQWGVCAMRALLAGIGAPEQAMFSEGSGLSRRDLVTPAALTSLLTWVARQPFAGDFKAALPIAAVDGTLKNRLAGSAAAGTLTAKTGTLTHVYALSGYVPDASGRQLAFSLLLNHYQRPRDASGRPTAPAPRDDLDAIAAMLAAATWDPRAPAAAGAGAAVR